MVFAPASTLKCARLEVEQNQIDWALIPSTHFDTDQAEAPASARSKTCSSQRYQFTQAIMQ
jgi:hypothetical protein